MNLTQSVTQRHCTNIVELIQLNEHNYTGTFGMTCFRAMHESMTSQKIKKLGAGGGAKLGGGPKLLVGRPWPPRLPRWLRAWFRPAHLPTGQEMTSSLPSVGHRVRAYYGQLGW